MRKEKSIVCSSLVAMALYALTMYIFVTLIAQPYFCPSVLGKSIGLGIVIAFPFVIMGINLHKRWSR